MPLVYLLMLISTLGSWVLPGAFAHVDPGYACLGLFWLLLGASIVAKIGVVHAAVCLDQTSSVSQASSIVECYRAIVQWSWIGGAPWLLGMVGYTAWSDLLMTGLDSWFVELWAHLAPWMGICLVLDLQSHQWRSHVQSVAKSTSPLASPASQRWFPAIQAVCAMWQSARHGWMIVLAPIAALALLMDLVQIVPAAREDGLLGIQIAACLIVAALIPSWLPRLIGVTSLPSNDRARRVREIWARVGLDPTRVRLWPTQFAIANAMVVGWFPRRHHLIVSDVIMERLSDEELEMVVLHESAHALRWHSVLRNFPLLCGILSLAALHRSSLLENMFALEGNAVWSIAALATGLAAVLVVTSLIGRWSELDADRYAIELSIRLRGSFYRAEAKDHLARAITKIVGARQLNRNDWMHPSAWMRVRHIQQV
jgi:Zn-dependent protease with chaperone function